MARVSPLARRCDLCAQRRPLTLVLTCYRNVYTYRWLCAPCRDGTRDEARA